MDRLRHSTFIGNAGGTAAMANPVSGLTVVPTAVGSARSSVKSEANSVLQGRVSLAALDFLIIAVVGFYWWTKGIQGSR